MAKKQYWNKTSAFAHFGVKLENVQWSWSGQSVDDSTVAVVLWQDGVRRRAGRFEYRDDEDLDAPWRRRKGHERRVAHLKHCRDQLRGKFRAIIARAEDVDADPRKIQTCFPQANVFWQIDTFDEATGAFVASVCEEV